MKRARMIISLLISVLLICALMPTLAFADGEAPTEAQGGDVLDTSLEQADEQTLLNEGEEDTSEITTDTNAPGSQPTDGSAPSELSTEPVLVATGFAATLDTTNTSDSTDLETLAADDYIEIDIGKIDGIAYMDFLNIELRVLPATKKEIGLFVNVSGGGDDLRFITIGGVPVPTIDNEGDTVKTYRFIGDGSPGQGKAFSKGIQLSINGKDIERTIAIECGNETTGLTLDSSGIVDPSIARSAASSAIGLSNGAHVQMTLNNNVSLASRAGYAGINVPDLPPIGDMNLTCQLDICGAATATATPTLTATAGIGAAGIGGDAGTAFSNEGAGESAGSISLNGHLTVVATGGEASADYSGGAGIGGGGMFLEDGVQQYAAGGNSSYISATGNVTITATGQGEGAGIGGGGGGSELGEFGGSSEYFTAYADASGAYPTITASSTGFGSGIGGGGGLVGGKGGEILLGYISTGASTPLFVTATSESGNDLGAAPGGADTVNDWIIIRGGSIVADSFGVAPSDGSNPVYPVVIPKVSDGTPATTLTGHLGFEVPVSGTTTYHATSVDSTSPEHGATFGYAAQLWLPKGFIVGIIGASSDKSVSIKGGHVDVAANMTPDYASGENIVSFKELLFELTLDYALSGSELTPVIVEVAGGSEYALPSEQKIHATWRMTGWSDGSSQYQLGDNFAMPWADASLGGIWTQRTLAEILIPNKTDDLTKLLGSKNAQIGLDVELKYLKEVGYTDAQGANYKALTKDKQYRMSSGSTLITMQSSWLATLKPGNYHLRVTYTDHFYDIPFSIATSDTPIVPKTPDGTKPASVIPKTADDTGRALLSGALFLALGVLSIAAARHQRKKQRP